MSQWKLYKGKDAITERPDEEENVTDREKEAEAVDNTKQKSKVDKIVDFHNENKANYDFLSKDKKSSKGKQVNPERANDKGNGFKVYDNKGQPEDEFKDVDLEFEVRTHNGNLIDQGEHNHKNLEDSLPEKENKKDEKKETAVGEDEKFISLKSLSNGEKIRTSISFSEAWNFFATQAFEAQKKKIVTEDFSKYNCFQKLLLKCSSKLELNKNLVEERDKIFSIAKTDLDYQDEFHMRILQTIFRNLTDEKVTSFDWKIIGFQGDDPKTDLRAAGMLGLLQILHFTEKFPDFAREMLHYSHDSLYHFPLVCLFLNFTLISLESLREGDLIDHCNKKRSVINTMNEFFAGSVFYFFFQYKSDGKTINDIGRMIQLLNGFLKANVSEMLSIYEEETVKVAEKGNNSLNEHH